MDSSDGSVCDYEKKRMKTMEENSALLQSLGIDIIKRKQVSGATARNKRRTVRRGFRQNKIKRCTQYNISSSSDSEEDWFPGMEENSRVPVTVSRAERTSTNIFNFEPFTRDDDFAPSRGCSTPLMEEYDSAMLPDWLRSFDEDSEEFYGYTIHDDDDGSDDECTVGVHVSQEQLSDNWFKLFGKDDDRDNNDFEGFELDDVQSPPRFNVSRYPRRRNKVGVVYIDEELSDEDHYLFCEDCSQLHHGQCPSHGPLLMIDPVAGFDVQSKHFTNLPVPKGLTVKTSSIPEAGLGVFALHNIPKRIQFGPYEGELILKSELSDSANSNYMWEIKPSNGESYLVDGKSDVSSNWLKFVNCARNEEEQNLVAFQYHSCIYYRTFKDIPAGKELFVWYGEQYARDLGISTNYSSDYHYTCKHCGASFIEKSSFNIHIKRSKSCYDSNPQKFVCLKCHERYSELHLLQDHVRKHFNNLQKSFKTTNNSCRSTRKDEKERNHYCNICKESCRTNDNLQDHCKLFHSNHSNVSIPTCASSQGDIAKKKRYNCEYCGKEFSLKHHLVYHIRTHTGEKPYKCDYCGERFSTNGNLVNHIRTHTGEKPYKCDYCGDRFSTNGNLVKHIRTHTGEKPYKCDYCGDRFSTNGSLVKHIRTHTGEKPYKCDYCGERFSINGNLVNHIRTHTGEKPYKCDYCGQRFSINGNLVKHIRTHTGEKPYKCDYCGERFSINGNLVKHIRTHTGEKPYKCDYCGQRFSQKNNLMQHMKRWHDASTAQ